jgi:uncharacterized protein YbaA (DUF1428 family)
MAYVDGFVIAVPKKNIAAYKKIARVAGKVWKECGAIDYKECVGDDLNVKYGLSFAKLTKAKANETIIFSFITYKSRAHRDTVNKKVMTDPRMAKLMKQPMPFNDKRMTWGGFKAIVDM